MVFNKLFIMLFIFLLVILLTGLLIQNTSFSVQLSDSVKDVEDNNPTPLEHIIVLSQGRRSFDNYFGTYPGANGFPNNISIPINPLENSIKFNNFTINLDLRFNNSNSKTDKFIITKGGLGKETPGDNLNFGVLITRDSKIKAGFEDKQGKDIFVYSNNRYNDDKWHNIIVSYDGDSLNLYIDKKLVAKKNTSNAIPDDNRLPFIRVGANFLKTELFYTGDLDGLKIWNRSLTENEINLLLNGKEKNYDALVDFDRDFNSNSEFISFNGSNYFDIKATSKNPHTVLVKPFNLQETKTPQLSFDKTVFEKSFNYGFMDGFIYAQNTDSKDNENIVMGFYDNKTIGLYWLLASEFVLADNFFGSSSNDLANNLRLYSLDSNSYKKNVPPEGLNINSTIFDILEKNNITWKIYVENYDPNLNYTRNDDISKRHLPLNPILTIPRFVENSTLNSKIVDLSQYFKDLKNGLPSVAYIISSNSHESSPKDILKGEEFVTTLITALMQSKYWKDSVFILTYSSSGGWYDHVMPSQIKGTQEGPQLGFRVPTIIISPYAKTGVVDSTIYDSSSILKFIANNNNLTLIDSNESTSNNLMNSFDFNTYLINPKKIVNDLTNEYEIRKFGTDKKDESYDIYLIFILYSLILVSILIVYFTVSLERIKKRKQV